MAGDSADMPDSRGSGSDRVGDLLRRIADGDQAALALVYDATSSRVFGDILSIVGERARGQAILQDTYLAVWRSAQDFAGGDGTAWVLAVARSAATVESRQRRAPQDGAATTAPAGEAPSPLGEVSPPLTARSSVIAQVAATPQGEDAVEQPYASPADPEHPHPSPAVDPAPTTNTLQAIQRTNWTRGLILLVASMIVLVALGWASVAIHEVVTGAGGSEVGEQSADPIVEIGTD